MSSTHETELNEIDAAVSDLARARAAFDLAIEAASHAPGPGDPLTEVKDEQWIRVVLAQHRYTAAISAHAAGDRHRSRWSNLRAVLGLKARNAPAAKSLQAASVIAAGEDTHRATLAFVANVADHDEAEDLHPPRLDHAAADLDHALAHEAIEKKNAQREARDA